MTTPRTRRALAVLGLAGALLTAGLGTDVAEAAPAAPAAPAKAQAPAATTQAVTPMKKTVRYGPYTIQPAAENPDGTHGHANLPGFNANVEKPCTNCYIVGMKPDMVKATGERAGHSNNLMLHHMVLFNSEAGRTDATCPTGLGSLGQRFFASGDERTITGFPDNYGYKVGSASTWNLVWELASMSDVPETVYYTVEFTYVPASTPGMRDVEPVWMDIDQCADSHVAIPAGPSSQSWTWNVNRLGAMLTVGGHVHDHGINLEVRNVTKNNALICDSRASYGTEPLYIDHHGVAHISKMSTCGGPGLPPIAQLASGDQVRITSHYDAPAAVPDAMGIAVAYMARDGGGTTPPPGGTCVTATNQAHIDAGRATAVLFFFAFAKGSNQYLGLTFQSTSLKQDGTGWKMVASC
jgi:hypothetical protein